MRKAIWLFSVLSLLLAGCDAGPSAVMHDGDGKSPTRQDAPAEALAAPAQSRDKTQTGDIEEASMPIPGDAAAGPVTPQDVVALKVPAGHALITETKYRRFR